MAKRIRDGLPWLRWDGLIPKLVVHEKHERNVRWSIRTFTGMGVAASLISLPTEPAFGLALGLVALNAFLERTLFYFTSLYITALPAFTYDPDKWLAMVYVSFGPPSPDSDKIVGLVFSDKQYAKDFFNLLRAWNNGSSQDTENNIQLSFITDEDLYYVYLYPSIEKSSIKQALAKAKRQGRFKKYGKEHVGLVMQMVICHGFETAGHYALGEFTDNHPHGRHFLLGAFYSENGRSQPEPIEDVEPISKFHYKAKVKGNLTDEDFELAHWKRLVRR